jgi:hypothetical protein
MIKDLLPFSQLLIIGNFSYPRFIAETDYSDSTGNSGAWINIKKDLKLQFETFEAVPHPNVKPMAYASNLVGSMM